MYPVLLTVLADPARMRIAETLRLGERAVADIVASVGIRQSGVSRHLGILQDAGIVSVRPDGQRRIYSLRPEPFQEIEAWVAGYRGLWEDRLDRFGAELDRRTSARKTSQKGDK
ncbi:MAG TPA: metalloregulator ArsR/SmtB family transcription factor [Telluria sp.]|nr:metalloregulator ArsR/SmtB family transcription factor [Telluria sp.]